MFGKILKVIGALAAVAGAVYVIATYGDRIVAWAKSLIEGCPCCKGEVEAEVVEVTPAEETVEEVAEEAVEEVVEEVVEEEAAPAEEAPVAEEKDFEA